MKMVQTIMGGTSESERQINRNQIKRELIESVVVEVDEIKNNVSEIVEKTNELRNSLHVYNNIVNLLSE